MAIRCAHCKDSHETVAEVRSCSGIGVPVGVGARTGEQRVQFSPSGNNRGGYVATPLNGVVRSESGALHRGTPVDRIRAASRLLPNVERCFYAVTDTDGVWKFYRVDRPKSGKWAGYTFVKVQASDDLYPVKNLTSVYQILEAIAENPQKAASDYGHQIGKCGICSRTLTDPDSIDRGIGPVCAANAGW